MSYHKKFKKYESKLQKLSNKQTGGNNNEIFVDNIEKLTIDNSNYRKVIYTTKSKNMQLVLMSLKPSEEIGMEVHDVDQFFRIDQGKGQLIYDKSGEKINQLLKDGDAIIIPAGTYHNIINIDPKEKLKLYTIYTPANHPDGRLQENKPIEEKH